jgi:hypothetical protein
MTGDRQIILVVIAFRKSNKNSLKLRAGADRSSRKKKRHILVNSEVNVVIFNAAYFYFIFNQLWQETTIHSRSIKTCSTKGVLGWQETVVLIAAAASFQSAAICILYHILPDTAYIMNNQTLSNPPPFACDSAKRNNKTQKRKYKV